MALTTEGKFETDGRGVAAADYRTKQGCIVKIDTAADYQWVLIASNSVRGDGVLLNKPNTGEACEVATDGMPKALCGAAIASGGLELTTDSTGRLVTASSTNVVMAFSLNTTAAAGEWVSIKLVGPYVKP